MIIRHAQLLAAEKGEYTAVREMRKHVAWYIKGIPHAGEIRNQVNQIDEMREFYQFVQQI